MKTVILLGLLLAPVSVWAGNVTFVEEVATSSGTAYTVAVASQPAVDVASITVTGKLFGAYAIEVYNTSSSTNTINCSYDQNVSTTQVSASGLINTRYGREIPAGSGMVWHVLQATTGFGLRVFCMSQSVVGPTAATITQLR